MQTPTAATGLRARVSPDWQQTYEEHATALLHYLIKLTGEREAAIEIVQDTFVRGIRTEIREGGAVRAWLFTTATNLAITRARRQRLVAFLPFSGREAAADPAFDETAEQVRQALRAIPPDQAATLLLHYQSGFTRTEIAQMQGLSEEAVKSRLSRGRQNFIAAYRRLERGLAR